MKMPWRPDLAPQQLPAPTVQLAWVCLFAANFLHCRDREKR
jgi:hypothetical protein